MVINDFKVPTVLISTRYYQYDIHCCFFEQLVSWMVDDIYNAKLNLFQHSNFYNFGISSMVITITEYCWILFKKAIYCWQSNKRLVLSRWTVLKMTPHRITVLKRMIREICVMRQNTKTSSFHSPLFTSYKHNKLNTYYIIRKSLLLKEYFIHILFQRVVYIICTVSGLQWC